MATATLIPFAAHVERPEDQTSMQAARAGDHRAFERLYRQHVDHIYGLCLRMTGNRALAEDCTQECIIAAWRALPAFEARSRLATWLHRIAVNCVLARRTRQLDQSVSMDAVMDEALAVPGADTAVSTLDVERAIACLSAAVAAAFLHGADSPTQTAGVAMLAPDTQQRVHVDLDTIRAANADIRQALKADPASPILLRLLANTWQQEISLYMGVARATQSMQRNNETWTNQPKQLL